MAIISIKHQEWMPQVWILRPGKGRVSAPGFLGNPTQIQAKSPNNRPKLNRFQKSASPGFIVQFTRRFPVQCAFTESNPDDLAGTAVNEC